MPRDTYYDRKERSEECKCVKPVGTDVCLVCGGRIERSEPKGEHNGNDKRTT
jgi:hypothetical protein